MVSYRHAQNFSPRLRLAIAATLIAFVVALVASINLYLLEDNNPLTQAAYSASPVLRFSYDGVYLSALVACVAVCAMLAYAIFRANRPVIIVLVIVALFVALAGFGGLIVRYPITFLVLFLVFVGLTLVSILLGRAVAARYGRRPGLRSGALLGACASAGVALLINVVALVAHTLVLNPVSHALFMQGQIGGTHFSSLLIAMGLELLTVIICVVSIGFAFGSAARSS